jgi:hypothetical protein
MNFTIALLTVTLAASSAFGGSEKLSPELKEGGLSGNIDVIVQYQTTPSPTAHQKLVA